LIEGPFYFIFSFVAGIGFWLAVHMLVGRERARRRRDRGAEPPRTALTALHYGYNPRQGSTDEPPPGIPFLAICALLLLRPGSESWEYYLWGGFALLCMPGTWLELREFARELTVGPAIAAHEEGLYLAEWRGTQFVPWTDVAFVYTDPPDTDGYIADEMQVKLHVESRSGRSWRYSSRDFPPGIPAEFARLIELATLRTAPPGSMLTHGNL
jgi:hypothetical protein